MPEKYLSLTQTDSLVAEILSHGSGITEVEHNVLNDLCSAHNYKPLPVVLKRGRSVWVWDINGKKYMDCLSAYSACNAGHSNLRIVLPVIWQMLKLDTVSRAFIHDKQGPFAAELARFCGKDKVLVKNAGVESVETAIKAARRYGYRELKIPDGKAEIVVANDNFHGRTIAALAISTEAAYKDGFGPFPPGFPAVPFGDIEAMRAAVNENTCAVMIEPIQGEAGVNIPRPGYINRVRELCTEKGILMIADEIQVGLGRTGNRFACDYNNVIPDIYIIGKALGGNLVPVSAIAANDDILGLFGPGSDGSTFGHNPIASVAGLAYLREYKRLHLEERSDEMGRYFMDKLREIDSRHIKEIRGRGLLIGVELNTKARPFCEALMKEGLLCKETHDMVIRFAPPLVITKKEIDWAIKRIKKVLEA